MHIKNKKSAYKYALRKLTRATQGDNMTGQTPHTETNAEAITRLNKLADEYKSIIEMQILVDTPFIVEVGALTVTTDDNGVIKTHNTAYPTEFTDKAVKKINTCTFRDGSGKIIKPVIFRRKAWYAYQLESINMVVNHLG